MEGLARIGFVWKKRFEYYNIEFGIYDGTFVLYSKIFNMKLELNFDVCICLLKKRLTVVSDCFHVSGSLRSSF